MSTVEQVLSQTNPGDEIAFSGREHLVAVGALSDSTQKGLMLYTLRYEMELRDFKSALADVK